MPDTRLANIVLLFGAFIVVGGCQMVGPVAIDQGRDRYNRIIQSTSKEQTFENIIRVYHHEPTVFMDVTEVDATTTFSGTGSGGASNIGAKLGTSGGTLAGQTESVAGGITYSESPLVRYQPLLGQALVAQLATPVGPEALASLYDSNWGVAPLLDLSTAFMTLDYDDSAAALNAITQLDRDNAVELVAEKSDVTKEKASTSSTSLTNNKTGNVTLQVTNKPSSGGTADALVIYYLPPRTDADKRNRDQRYWALLQVLYKGTQTTPTLSNDTKCKTNSCKKPLVDPNRIELRTMPVTPAEMTGNHLNSGAPLMKTFSAVGILKNAVEIPNPKIEFVTRARFDLIRSRPWNNFNADTDLTFYTLLPGDELQEDEKLEDVQNDRKIISEVSNWLLSNHKPFLYYPERPTEIGLVQGNRWLLNFRRYVLVIRGKSVPANAYVAHFDRGDWYYIDGDDTISQKNFDLLSLLMTMMATASTSTLTPAISVGGM